MQEIKIRIVRVACPGGATSKVAPNSPVVRAKTMPAAASSPGVSIGNQICRHVCQRLVWSILAASIKSGLILRNCATSTITAKGVKRASPANIGIRLVP